MFYLSLPTWEAWIEIVLNVMLILLQPSSMFQNRETKIEQKGSVLHMLAAEKRKFAEQSLQLALLGDYKAAAQIRQKAYAGDYVGSIGVDWNNWKEIWKLDSRYLTFMNAEDFSDVDNSPQRINSLKAGIFVDYLYEFRDYWGVHRQSELSDEQFQSAALETFLKSMEWTFKSVDREQIYAATKKKNISSKIYLSSLWDGAECDRDWAYVFESGEYDLGFYPGTPKEVIDARRHWLERYEQFETMQELGIEKFPKTFTTFEKHMLKNSEKYQNWIIQYNALISAKR